MKRYAVDTNVPIVANGKADPGQADRLPSLSCREAAIRFLMALLGSGKVLLDDAGAIQTEYRRHLDPKGQPGVGDRFYQQVIHYNPQCTERVHLPLRGDGEYADLPQELIDGGFDPSDRKFAALARRRNAPVINATDSDWVNAATVLSASGIEVEHLCGCDMTKWFKT